MVVYPLAPSSAGASFYADVFFDFEPLQMINKLDTNSVVWLLTLLPFALDPGLASHVNACIPAGSCATATSIYSTKNMLLQLQVITTVDN